MNGAGENHDQELSYVRRGVQLALLCDAGQVAPAPGAGRSEKARSRPPGGLVESAMNKSDLVAAVSEQMNVPHRRADRAVNEVFRAISRALVRGERIELRGFGAWWAKHYRARNGRNPKTGEPISVPEKRLPLFRAGKNLSERITRAFQRVQSKTSS